MCAKVEIHTICDHKQIKKLTFRDIIKPNNRKRKLKRLIKEVRQLRKQVKNNESL